MLSRMTLAASGAGWSLRSLRRSCGELYLNRSFRIVLSVCHTPRNLMRYRAVQLRTLNEQLLAPESRHNKPTIGFCSIVAASLILDTTSQNILSRFPHHTPINDTISDSFLACRHRHITTKVHMKTPRSLDHATHSQCCCDCLRAFITPLPSPSCSSDQTTMSRGSRRSSLIPIRPK